MLSLLSPLYLETIVSEARFPTASWPPANVTLQSNLPRNANPLQESFIRLEEAETLRQQKKLDRAQKICESLLRSHPDYMAALHTLGLIYADKENYQRAFDCLARAAMINPRSWSTLTALSGVYLELDAPEMAAQALEQAKALKPNDPSILVTLGEIYRKEREYEFAKDAYRQALNVEPGLEPAASGLGWVCSYIGEYAEAAEIFEKLIDRKALSLSVLSALSSLPSAFVKTDILAELGKVARSETEDKAATDNAIAFMRAIALDKMGRHREAWEAFVPANRTMFAAMRDEYRQDTERESVNLATLQGNVVKPAGDTNEAGRTISLFILGPSRSGKTTLEQLVGNLAGVKCGYENPGVELAVKRTFQTAGLLTTDFFELLPPQLYPLCREIYLEQLTRRAGSANVFTNTHPLRILDAPLIATVFPNVRFLFVKRDVDDTVLRIYQRKYREGNAYSYDLGATRKHVLWYHQMMDTLAKKLPDHVRIIDYKDMVADPARAVRTAAELCGVEARHGPLPVLRDDSGCAQHYREYIDSPTI